MTDAKLAAGLTKAQRAAMVSKSYAIPSMGPHGYDSVMLGFSYGRVAKALHARGLTNTPLAPQILTPLGLRVRALLKGQDDA